MNKKAKTHLQTALDGYRNNLAGVTDYVAKAKENLEKATAHKQEMLDNIAELEGILGDDAQPTMEMPFSPTTETVEA